MSLPIQAPAARPGRSFVSRALRYASRVAKRIAPRGLNVSAPICQIFLGGNGKKSVYTFMNFPSLYRPTGAYSCCYDLTLHDAAGETVGDAKVSVPPYASIEVRLEEVMDGLLPELGVLSAQIRPQAFFSYADRHLGTITAHFFAMYHDEGMRSVCVIHPQTELWRHTPPRPSWRSNLLIRPDGIDSLEIFQMNPASTRCSSTLSVCDPQGAPIVSATAEIEPFGARRLEWKASQFGGRPFVALTADALTAPNAKPLIFQHHASGFSAAHG